MENSNTQVEEKTRPRIIELDGLRGVAILLVLICHFAEWAEYNGSNTFIKAVFFISSYGFTGVDLFFVLSGFLICGILLDNRNAPNYFRVFYIRRAFRILPLYYGLLGLFCLLVLASINKVIDAPFSLFGFEFHAWSYFTFTQNFFMAATNSFGTTALGPTWSLAVEEQFYLTFPFIIRFTPRKYLVAILFLGICMAIILRIGFIIWLAEYPFTLSVLMPTRADSLLVGALAAIAFRSDRASRFISKHRLKLFVAFPVLIILSMMSIYLRTFANPLYFHSYLFSFVLPALAYVTLLFMVLMAKEGNSLGKILRNKVLLEFGALSYFIYLTHVGVLQFYHWQFGISGKTPVGFLWIAEISLGLFTCLFFAKVSQKFFEHPLIRLGHRFKYKSAKV